MHVGSQAEEAIVDRKLRGVITAALNRHYESFIEPRDGGNSDVLARMPNFDGMYKARRNGLSYHYAGRWQRNGDAATATWDASVRQQGRLAGTLGGRIVDRGGPDNDVNGMIRAEVESAIEYRRRVE